MTHYEILGIRKTASTDEIKTAYKQLVKKYHPDVYPGDKTFAEKKTQEINAAYDVLSDPDKKREYDELINPHTSTSYTPPDYNGYTYNPSYSRDQKNSKRNAQAQGSKYSYENYKKTYNSTGAYDFNKRYTDYHRSKTPNSNYAGSNPNPSSISKESVIQLSKASKLFIIGFILILYVIFFISNIMELSNIMDSSKDNSKKTETTTSSSQDKTTDTETYKDKENDYNYDYDYDFDIESYIYGTPSQTYEEYYNKKYNNTVEEEKSPAEEFDINTVYTDAELREVYDEYFQILYPTFEEFKKAMGEYYYQTYYQDYY